MQKFGRFREVIKSSYHLHGKFTKIFRKKIRSCFSHSKKGTGLSCTIYKIPLSTFSWEEAVFYTNGKRSKSLLITAYGQLCAHAHYRQCSAYAHAQFGHRLWRTRWRPAPHFPTKLQNQTNITIIALGSQNIVICRCLAEQSLPLIRGNERSSRPQQITISAPPSNSLRRDDLFPSMPFT